MMKQKLQSSRTLVITWCSPCAQQTLQVVHAKCRKQPKMDEARKQALKRGKYKVIMIFTLPVNHSLPCCLT